ncbi:MAG: carbamoyltransferase C-terminal domain-containing protein, partial [Vicinamibacterales bacterium]
DGTSRPHMVPDDDTGLFAELLRRMRQATGMGAVLNTSLYLHGSPLVCTPEEAVDVFVASDADALAIGPFLVARRHRSGHTMEQA